MGLAVSETGGKRSLIWIELFRCVAACAVVLTHINMVTYLFADPTSWWSIALCAATKFSVPTFMIVASFLHTKSLAKHPQPPAFKQTLYKKWHALLIPYFIWNVIYLCSRNLEFKLFEWNADNIWTLIMGADHLYFISILMQFFVVYHFFHKKHQNAGFKKPFLICVFISVVFYLISEAVLWTVGQDNNFFEWYIGNSIFGWSIFFAWGVYLAKDPNLLKIIEENLSKLLALTIVAYGFYVFEINLELTYSGGLSRLFFLFTGLFYQFFAGAFVLSCCLHVQRLNLSKRSIRMIKTLGRYTFGVYLAHNFFIPIWVKIFAVQHIDQPALKLSGVFFLTILSCIILEITVKRALPQWSFLLYGRSKSMTPLKDPKHQKQAFTFQ